MSFLDPSSQQSASPPPFKKVDITSTAAMAEAYANLGYQYADADFLQRFPGLVAMRDSEINNAASQVLNPLDPTVENSFATTAASGATQAFGGGGGAIGEEGSAARGAIAANVANATSQKQDYDWNTLMGLINNNPERQFGLTGGDLLNLMIGNTVGKNQANFAGYQSRLGLSNAQNQATTQESFAGAQLALSIIGIAL